MAIQIYIIGYNKKLIAIPSGKYSITISNLIIFFLKNKFLCHTYIQKI